MNFDDFVNQTNIEQIIREEYNRPNRDISEEEMEMRLKFYYDFRMNTAQWNRNGIKNLQFKECECKRKQKQSNGRTECEGDVINDGNAGGPIAGTSTTNISQSKGNKTNSINKSNSSTHFEPNAFQRAIIDMDYKTFVEHTNIKEVVSADVRKRKNITDVTEAQMDYGLKYFYGNRAKSSVWKGVLNHLKFKMCDKFTETSISVQDMEIQCNLDGCNTNENEETPRPEQQQHSAVATNSEQSKATEQSNEVEHSMVEAPTDETALESKRTLLAVQQVTTAQLFEIQDVHKSCSKEASVAQNDGQADDTNTSSELSLLL